MNETSQKCLVFIALWCSLKVENSDSRRPRVKVFLHRFYCKCMQHCFRASWHGIFIPRLALTCFLTVYKCIGTCGWKEQFSKHASLQIGVAVPPAGQFRCHAHPAKIRWLWQVQGYNSIKCPTSGQSNPDKHISVSIRGVALYRGHSVPLN